MYFLNVFFISLVVWKSPKNNGKCFVPDVGEKKQLKLTSKACFRSFTHSLARQFLVLKPSLCLFLSSSSFCPLTQETLALPRHTDKEVEGPSLPLQISCNCRVIKRSGEGEKKRKKKAEEERTDTMWRTEQPEKWLMWAVTLWFTDSYQPGQPFAHYSRLRAAEDWWLRSNNHHQPWPLW